mmetsp:Transcript_14432/g.22267  ORF Transcript_14432/g.22267 Transcript_14432/m.22267 type:complete len:259 (+) Transcript_14432:154-930(+)|eukprot:CAMPEP_0201728866 /NCGR_PEP_ID=MMETSP0593-20130828/17272_1 /ASSEMBLY_ACC=CAM_ASM_000672 /TAXON_ID=267983 /ORGANISM="Skeletonema japonicum, Strain CCMP2506" /LENGTH=258 /DNA_ID=CAMNT_0048221091 /DNA_START=79 /DNA_END=855 /DNA_ORIENTATION=+
MGEKSAITAISWTGGKDCNLALLYAERDPSLDVRYLVVFRISEKAFHAHPIPLMRQQAKSLGLELLFVDFPEGTTDYFQAYVDGIRNLHDTYGIMTISTGDMDLVGTMERNWMERCCEAAGIKVHLPLWAINREEALNIMIEEGFEIIFSCVKSPFFDASWINRKLDRTALEDMKKIITSGLTPEQINDGVKTLDLCGERGEYHSMCVGGPLYKNKICLDIYDEPNKQVTKQTSWKGNIHNSNCLWTISLKGDAVEGN